MVQIRLASLAPLQDYQKRKIAKESVEKQQLRNKLIPVFNTSNENIRKHFFCIHKNFITNFIFTSTD